MGVREKRTTPAKGKVSQIITTLESLGGIANTVQIVDAFNERYRYGITKNEAGQLLAKYPHFQKVADGERQNGRLAVWEVAE